MKLVLGAAVIVWPMVAIGQSASVTLTKPDRSLAEPFTQVTAVRELSADRILVADSEEKTVHLANFAAGSTKPVGRQGKGPGEYTLPLGLIPLPDGGPGSTTR